MAACLSACLSAGEGSSMPLFRPPSRLRFIRDSAIWLFFYCWRWRSWRFLSLGPPPGRLLWANCEVLLLLGINHVFQCRTFKKINHQQLLSFIGILVCFEKVKCITCSDTRYGGTVGGV